MLDLNYIFGFEKRKECAIYIFQPVCRFSSVSKSELGLLSFAVKGVAAIRSQVAAKVGPVEHRW